MDWVSGIVVYILLWWWVLFMTLPFGAKPPAEVKPGHASSAPEKPMLRRKMLITTGIAGLLWLVVNALINAEVYSFRN